MGTPCSKSAPQLGPVACRSGRKGRDCSCTRAIGCDAYNDAALQIILFRISSSNGRSFFRIHAALLLRLVVEPYHRYFKSFNKQVYHDICGAPSSSSGQPFFDPRHLRNQGQPRPRYVRYSCKLFTAITFFVLIRLPCSSTRLRFPILTLL